MNNIVNIGLKYFTFIFPKNVVQYSGTKITYLVKTYSSWITFNIDLSLSFVHKNMLLFRKLLLKIIKKFQMSKNKLDLLLIVQSNVQYSLPEVATVLKLFFTRYYYFTTYHCNTSDFSYGRTFVHRIKIKKII